MYMLKKYLKMTDTERISFDGITIKVLKNAIQVLDNRFLNVINNSLCGGILPQNWKNSSIIRVVKNINTKECEEFRPVNLVLTYE